ncbi:MAG: fatty acid hydroxylase family protein, partial [Gemmatimonadales bacterium]
LLTVIYLLEVFNRADRSSYFSKTFLQDLLYALFYQGGFYTILLWAAIANAFSPRLDFFKIDVLAGLPGPVHWVLYWLVVDFITYWWHRMLHTWGPLWAFHSVHHTQEKMSFISSYRLHPFEQLAQNFIMVVPLLILGVPTFRWLPLYAAMNVFEAAQHSALDWGYGRGYFVFVSPRFHSVHHSTDPKHYNRNYAKILSLWDFMFGTGVYEARRPERLGVEGLPIPGSIGAQLAAPFQILAQQRDRASESEPAAAAPEPRPIP